MILCLDIGNTNLFGGVYHEDQLISTFRRDMRGGWTADEVGIFLRNVLRENEIAPQNIKHIGISSVVPSSMHSIKGACVRYFGIDPYVLSFDTVSSIQIKTQVPSQLGADRIANSIAAVHKHPGKDLIIIDFGTATTFCAVNKDAHYLGGAILAGVRISMEALESRTAQLPNVEIVRPESALGTNTVEGIQSGLYYGNVGAIRELNSRLSTHFNGRKPLILATGGFARIFEEERIFDEIIPDLVLEGLRLELVKVKKIVSS